MSEAIQAPDAWFVQVGDQVYGPYSKARMLAFIAEGRVKPGSLVSRRKDEDFRAAADTVAFATAFAGKPAPVAAQPAPASNDNVANLALFTEFSGAACPRVENALTEIGRWRALGGGIYALRTREQAPAVRNLLAPLIEPGDRLLIVDSSRDRIAWVNMGPEAEARIREIWLSPMASAR